ncbi:MAG: hypothetical protein ACI3VA_07845 [Candidatus Limivicinus sp.]
MMALFLAIHKVFLQKSAIIRTQIFSRSALADLIIVYSSTAANLLNALAVRLEQSE